MRTRFILLLSAIFATSAMNSCERKSDQPSAQVVLYTSADPDILKAVADAFQKDTGIQVRAVGDTEATKTTGLVQRLLAEKDRPRADVWWSSEALGTIQLSQAGVLAPYSSDAAEHDFAPPSPPGWPTAMRGKNRDWYGFARRTRVLVYHTGKLKPEEVPTRLAGLAEPRFKGRVGIARPQFGTTRGHMAALLHAHGEEVFTSWLKSLRENGVRLYDGNASVVRAVNLGEIDLGLTDNDDVNAGQRNGWPVAMVAIGNQVQAVTHDRAGGGKSQPFPEGPLQTPCTVALVKGAPNADAARKLVDFLLSAKAERLLAASELATMPVNPKAYDPPLDPISDKRFVPITDLDLEAAAAKMSDAMRICGEVLEK